MKSRTFPAILILLHLFAFKAGAENSDSLSLSRDEVHDLFIKNSLVLIAAHYDIDAAKAAVLDARLLNNPYLQYAQHLYDPHSKKFFDVNSATGEWNVQMSQLFSIAGRHRNSVRLAGIREKMSELEYEDLVRSLMYELNDAYSKSAVAGQQVKLLDNESAKLQVLVNAVEQEIHLGQIAGNELIRITAELQEIQSRRAEAYSDLNEAENTLRILLNINQPTYINCTIEEPKAELPLPSIDSLESLAMNRPDLLLSHAERDASQQNLRLQKSLAWPDLTLMAEHDLNSSSVNNYNGIGIGLPLPLFSRNQGMISQANAFLQQSEINDSIASGKVRNEVATAYAGYAAIRKTISGNFPNLSQKLEEMNKNAFSNYSSHYINLLDFLDQIRTYTDAYNSLLSIRYQYVDAINKLNYSTGTIILNP
ncbi:MAG: TolC family protein [Bacteroidia bacterium]